MAVLAISNTLLYHAEALADIEALGSDDGIVVDTIAWVEATKNFYYPDVISAGSTTWTALATGGDNIYNADGTLDAARSVAFSTFDMTFSGTGNFIVNNTSKFLQNTPSVGQVATATAVDGGWTWQDAAGGTLEAAVESTGATNANMDQSFDWRITDGSQVLSFSDGGGTANLLSLAPDSVGGDAITIGNTDTDTTVSIDSDGTVITADANAITLRTTTNVALTGESRIIQVHNQGMGANGGGLVNIYISDFTGAIVAPTFSAPTGSLFIANSTTQASRIYQNTSVGVGAATGMTWLQLGTITASTLVQVDVTQSTGSLSASGGTVDLDITSFINEGQIIDLQVTRTAGTGGDDIDVEIYTEDTYTNRIYFAEAADASTKFRDSSGIFVEDLDASTELHIRITNQSAAAATFDVRARAQGEN